MAPKPAAKGTGPAKSSTRKVRQKAAPKQPLSPEERLKRLFNSLCAQLDGGHFSNAVKTCDKILRIEPKDPDALQTKLFLLLQTEQYSAALTFIDDNDAHAFEKAYSLYRTNCEMEAREALHTTRKHKGEDDRGATHLEAQLCYREGSYQAAFDLYNQLLDTAEPSSDEHADILTNLEAAQRHLDFINTGYLRALDGLPSATAAGLESAPPPQPSSLTATLTTAATSNELGPAKKEKKLRVKRLPKNVVLGVTPSPDPERWLKKSERSTYGQGGKRRRGGGGGATQGVVESSAPAASTAQTTKSSGKSKKKK